MRTRETTQQGRSSEANSGYSLEEAQEGLESKRGTILRPSMGVVMRVEPGVILLEEQEESCQERSEHQDHVLLLLRVVN